MCNDDRNLNLTGADHLNIDGFSGQDFKHAGGHARMVLHAKPNNGHFCNPVIAFNRLALELSPRLLGDGKGFCIVATRDGKSHICGSVTGIVLNNHVYDNSRVAQRCENSRRDARLIGYVLKPNLRLVAVAGYA